MNEATTIKVVHKLVPNVPYILIDPGTFDPELMTHYQEPEAALEPPSAGAAQTVEPAPTKAAVTKKASLETPVA
jgi:hypothetical protein